MNKLLRLVSAAALAGLATVALLACPPDGGQVSGPAAAKVTKLDLLSLHDISRQSRDTGIIDLASPFNTYYLARGWSHPYPDDPEAEDSPTLIAAVTRESVLRYNVYRPMRRWLVFRAGLSGKYGSLERQHVEVLADGRQVGAFDMESAQPAEYQVRIPVETQKVGENELTFRFSHYAENERYLTSRNNHRKNPFPGVAAYFREPAIYLDGENGPDREKARDETKALELDSETKTLIQRPDCEFSFAMDIRPGCKLSFSGAASVPPMQYDGLDVKVLARGIGEGESEVLWERSFKLTPDALEQTFWADVSLERRGITELTFCADAESGFSNVRVNWRRIELSMPQSPERTETGREPVRVPSGVKNLVIIVLDAAKPDYYGCYGDERGMTPNIDALAASAVLFRNAFTTAPYTIAAVSSIFSGLLPDRHGVRKIEQDEDGTINIYPEELQNMARVFKDNGYHTLTLSGTKWTDPDFGISKPCDSVLYLRDTEDIEASTSEMDFAVIEQGVAAAAESGKPVFIYAHFLPPHWPYNPPAPFNSIYIERPTATYWRSWMIKSLLDHGLAGPEHPDLLTHTKSYMNNLRYGDHVAGHMLELLRKYGLYDNSVIVITADHAEALGEHGNWGHNTTVMEEMIRIPLIIKVPGTQPREVRQQVGLIDFFPTFADLLGLELPEGLRFQGRSIAALLVGRDLETTDYYYSRAVSDRFIFTLRGERFKYVSNDFIEALYDLRSDPGEAVDVKARHPVLTTYLRQRGLMLIAACIAERGGQMERIELGSEAEKELRNLGYIQ